ncbi:hypothetical protein D3C79_874630 [compost metagenome]
MAANRIASLKLSVFHTAQSAASKVSTTYPDERICSRVLCLYSPALMIKARGCRGRTFGDNASSLSAPLSAKCSCAPNNLQHSETSIAPWVTLLCVTLSHQVADSEWRRKIAVGASRINEPLPAVEASRLPIHASPWASHPSRARRVTLPMSKQRPLALFSPCRYQRTMASAKVAKSNLPWLA